MRYPKSKVCTKCDKKIELVNFYKNKNAKDGLMSECKSCKKERGKKLLYNQEFRRKRRLRLDRYKKTQKGEIANKKYVVNLRLSRPEVLKARDKVKYAKRIGRLISEPCRICGGNEVEAHHKDYDKPLDVIWLCKKHHMEEHYALASR